MRCRSLGTARCRSPTRLYGSQCVEGVKLRFGRAEVRADRSKSARLADGGRRRFRATFRTREKIGGENGRSDRDTHHLRGETVLSGSPVLLQRYGLVSSLPLQMRARTSHDRYHYSWAHPAILPYIGTCTTSHVALAVSPPSSHPPLGNPFSRHAGCVTLVSSSCSLSLSSLALIWRVAYRMKVRVTIADDATAR